MRVTRGMLWREPAWFARPALRLLFLTELAARKVEPHSVKPERRFRGGFAVSLTLAPTGLLAQRVLIVFSLGSPEVPRVFAEASAESPHRYSDGSLCMWFPYDPPERRWTRRDGGGALLGHIAAHLMREEWWRRTGEWAGEEAPHGSDVNSG